MVWARIISSLPADSGSCSHAKARPPHEPTGRNHNRSGDSVINSAAPVPATTVEPGAAPLTQAEEDFAGEFYPTETHVPHEKR